METASEHLPVTPDHLLETEGSVTPANHNLPENPPAEEEQSAELPVERNLPDYSPFPVSPADAEESVDPEPLVSNASEPLNFDLSPDLIEPESGLRRSVRQRLPSERLQYLSLGNPLISVVQMLLHSISDALNPSPTASSVVHVV